MVKKINDLIIEINKLLPNNTHLLVDLNLRESKINTVLYQSPVGVQNLIKGNYKEILNDLQYFYLGIQIIEKDMSIRIQDYIDNI